MIGLSARTLAAIASIVATSACGFYREDPSLAAVGGGSRGQAGGGGTGSQSGGEHGSTESGGTTTESTSRFSCRDGSASIPMNWVCDDDDDCDDGSDEQNCEGSIFRCWDGSASIPMDWVCDDDDDCDDGSDEQVCGAA